MPVTIAVQIAPADAAPELEKQLLGACSADSSRARCVSAQELASEAPRAVALVSWTGAEHASVEVGFGPGDAAIWVSRQLDFARSDPHVERWRAVGFTIALLADDPRFWPASPASAEAPELPPTVLEPSAVPEVEPSAAPELEPSAPVLELRGLAGVGVVSGPWRWGAELRLAVPVSGSFFVTGSVDYALASEASLDLRWLDATLGVGVHAGSLPLDLEARFRLELMAENLAVVADRGGVADRSSVWVPGLALGADLAWPLGERWLFSTRVDAFWLDGSTPIVSAGRRVAVAAGAGVLLGAGAGWRF